MKYINNQECVYCSTDLFTTKNFKTVQDDRRTTIKKNEDMVWEINKEQNRPYYFTYCLDCAYEHLKIKKEERFSKGFLNAIKKLEQEGIIKQTKKDTYKLKEVKDER